MAPTTTNPALVQKEIIAYLHFPKEDVLTAKNDQKLRQQKLDKATTVGNIDHTKVRIIFEDIHGLKMTDTTIWATTENNVILKRGVVIPIHRIHDIQFV